MIGWAVAMGDGGFENGTLVAEKIIISHWPLSLGWFIEPCESAWGGSNCLQVNLNGHVDSGL